MMAALAFLPLDEVREAFIDLYDFHPSQERELLLDYFGRYYVTGHTRFVMVGGRLTMIRTPAMFPPSLWNQRESTLLGRERTNNRSEGNNHRLNCRYKANPPGGGVHDFIGFIQVNFSYRISIDLISNSF